MIVVSVVVVGTRGGVGASWFVVGNSRVGVGAGVVVATPDSEREAHEEATAGLRARVPAAAGGPT